jgi:hypothetical protein
LPDNQTLGLDRILITALVGAAAAYLHQLWKYNRDAYQSRVDEACKLIFELADIGAEYWSTPKYTIRRRPAEPPNATLLAEREKLTRTEAHIDGRLRELQFLRVLLQARLSISDKELLIDRTAGFQDAMTGGQFASSTRAADPQRAQQVYVSGADLVAHLRNASERANKWWRILFRSFERLLPYRRPTNSRGKVEELFILVIVISLFVIGIILCAITLWEWLG